MDINDLESFTYQGFPGEQLLNDFVLAALFITCGSY